MPMSPTGMPLAGFDWKSMLVEFPALPTPHRGRTFAGAGAAGFVGGAHGSLARFGGGSGAVDTGGTPDTGVTTDTGITVSFGGAVSFAGAVPTAGTTAFTTPNGWVKLARTA